MKHLLSIFIVFFAAVTVRAQCENPQLHSWHFNNSSSLDIVFNASANVESYEITVYALYTGSGPMPGTAQTTFTGSATEGMNAIEINPSVILDFTVNFNRYFYKIELATICTSDDMSDTITFYAGWYSMKNNPGFSCGTNSFSPMEIIPDTGGDPLEYSFEITSGPEAISDIGVLVDIGHLYNSDLSVSLISPAGTEVFLIDYPNNLASTSGLSMYFSDNGEEQSSQHQYGIFKPAQQLSAFEGESANGTWTLSVIDNTIGKYGFLFGVCLNFGDMTCVSSVSGSVFYDLNGNQIHDVGEPVFPYAHFHDAATDTHFYSDGNGKFYGCMSQTNNVIQFANKPKYHTVTPQEIVLNHQPGAYLQNVSVGIVPQPDMYDLEIKMWQIEPLLPNEPGEFEIAFKNIGTTCVDDALIEITLAEELNITAVSIANATFQNHTASIAIADEVCPFQNQKFTVSFDVGPGVGMGNILTSQAQISTSANEEMSESMSNNTTVLKSTVANFEDLNFKWVRQDSIDSWFLTSGHFLDYMIHFQNLSSNVVQNLKIEDEMDSQLNLLDFKIEEVSHPMVIHQEGNNFVFEFKDIGLSAKVVDEYESRGFVKYSIRPKEDIVSETVIYNTASLFPDDIPEVELNEVSTVFISTTGLSEITYRAAVYPNPTSHYLNISIPAEVKIQNLEVYDVSGKKVEVIPLQNIERQLIDVMRYKKGVYILQFVGDDYVAPVKWIKE